MGGYCIATVVKCISSCEEFQWVVEGKVVGFVLADSTCQTLDDWPLRKWAFHIQSEEHNSENR